MLVCLKYDLQEPLALHDLTRARVVLVLVLVRTTELLKIRWKET
jgi:hypothetical protein